MISAEQYQALNKEFHNQLEKAAREWLSELTDADFAQRIPYFRDGATNPKKWFEEGNDFRPLFILKEVSLGINDIEDLDAYLTKWANIKSFEFVEDRFQDVRVGWFKTWKRIAKLAKGLEGICNGEDEIDYYKYDFYYKAGEPYTGDVPGFKMGYKNQFNRTSNENYLDIMDKIAVVNVKKIGGGTAVGSEISQASGYYWSHLERFENALIQQINMLNPTVIVTCSADFTSDNIKALRSGTDSNIIWINGVHPSRTSTEKFYYQPLREYKAALRGEN